MNVYVKNHGSVNTNGKGFRLRYEREKLQDFVKQQQDYERGERIAERELERDRIASQEHERTGRIERRKKKGQISSRRKKKIELAKITAERDIEMARIEGIAEQADRDRELKRTELETDR